MARLAIPPVRRILAGIMDLNTDDNDWRALQEDIYREKVLRARRMNVGERLDEALRLTQSMFDTMHAEVMEQGGLADPELGWNEVRRRLDELRKREEGGVYRPIGEYESWRLKSHAKDPGLLP